MIKRTVIMRDRDLIAFLKKERNSNIWTDIATAWEAEISTRMAAMTLESEPFAYLS